MEEWDRFSTNKPTFFYFLSCQMALILIRGAMRQEAPSMQFPSVSCKGEIVLISGYLRVCMWACTFVYCILHARPSQGHTSNRRPVSQLVAGLNWRMRLEPFPVPPNLQTHTQTHSNGSTPPTSTCWIHLSAQLCLLALLNMWITEYWELVLSFTVVNMQNWIWYLRQDNRDEWIRWI